MNPGETSSLQNFALVTLVNLIKKETFEYIPQFIGLAQIFIAILFSIELIKESISLAHGEGFHLSKKLITWVFVSIVLSLGIYKGLADGIFKSAVEMGRFAFNQWGKALARFLSNVDDGMASIGLLDAFKPKVIALALGHVMALVVGGVCLLLIYVMVCGTYGCLALLIIVGPVAIAFLLNDDFRSIAIKWINSIINYLIIIPIYGVLMVLVSAILCSALAQAKNSLSGGSLMAELMIIMIGPLLSIGLIWQGPKAVMSLIGGVGGGGETAAGMAGMAMGMAAKGAIGALMKEGDSPHPKEEALPNQNGDSGGKGPNGGKAIYSGAGGRDNPPPGGTAGRAGSNQEDPGGTGGVTSSTDTSGVGQEQGPGSPYGSGGDDRNTPDKSHTIRPISAVKTKLEKAAEGARPLYSRRGGGN